VAKLFTIAKVVALIAISFFFIEAGLFFRKGITPLNGALISINSAANSLASDSIKLGKTLDMINNPDPRLGTIKLVNKDLVNFKDTLVLINESAKTFSDTSRVQTQYAQKWDEQITGTLSHVDDIAVTANKSISSITDSVNTTLAPAAPLLVQGRETLFDLQTRINDPNIPKITQNLSNFTGSTSEIAADAAFKLHQFVHPDKVKLGFWGTVDGGFLWAHSHVIPPLF
jgi:methyl-accepting chemotaxis protein